MRTEARFACIVGIVLASATAVAQQPREGFLLFTDPGQRFSIEFPEDWRWTIISGSGEPIATFVHPRSEAAVVVERVRLKQRLLPEDVTDLFADLEVQYIKENQRGITNINGRVSIREGMRSAIIDYNRPGLNEQERVRQYSFPVGDDLYRVTCMALATRFERHEANFAAIVATLKSAGELKKK